MNEELLTQMEKDLRLENEQLREAVKSLLMNIYEDVPEEHMTKHFITAMEEARLLLTDLGDIDHEEGA
jgi:ATP-dependent protease HslVU (ClpYQ) peptidase subunit